MRIRRAFAVAALAAFALISGPQADSWSPVGEALAKQSNGNAGGNGNNGNGAGNGNGGAQPNANITPVANAGRDLAVQAGHTVTLDGSGSYDGDGDPVSFHWELLGAPTGSAAQLDDPTAVRPAFTIDLPGEYEARLVVEDGLVASAPDHVIVSTGNLAPAADTGADLPVVTGDSVALDGASSFDANGDAIAFSWRIVGKPAGSGAALADPDAARTSFIADAPGDYVAELTVSDGAAVSIADRVTVSTESVAPAANAGADLVFSQPGAMALEAELSADGDGDALSFRWTVLRAPENARYQIRNSTERRAFLLFEDAGDYVVQLTVTDALGAAGIDTALVTGGNAPPVANAGPDRAVAAGGAVTLDASGSSDVNGDLLTARWALVARPDGSAAAIDNPGGVLAGFTADEPGTYIAQLIVDDGMAQSAPDTVVVTTGNAAPVADAGPDLWVDGRPGTAVTLDGGGSGDANGDALSYRWSLLQAPRGSRAALADAGALADFVPDRAGTYLVQLVVNDGTADSAPSFAVIAKGYGNLEIGPGTDQGDGNGDMAAGIGHDTNLRPVAEAGPGRTAPGGSLIQLDGSASSDPNEHVIHYEWALIFKPAGSTAELSDPAAVSPTFTADVSGIYVAQLVVRDAQIESFPDTVLIYANTAPVADAGPDQEVAIGSSVALDGTGSYDEDGDALTYAWSFATRPAGSSAAIDNATSAIAGFTPDVFGDYVVRLVVNDGVEDSAPDTATIKTFNNPPVAEAGEDMSATAGDVVTLDGTGSSDPDGQALSYSWRFTARPAGSAAEFDDAAAATPSFTTDLEGLYVAELTVNDGVVDSYPDVVGLRVGDGSVNHAPVLDAVGPLTVFLGETLTLQLSASDPDGDAVYFFANPLPLPRNMALNAMTGALEFRPDANQTGEFTVTLGASDGIARDSESVTVTVMTPPYGAPTSLAGRVLDASAQALGETVPVAGATVLLVETGQTATTDADGNFFISGTPSGDLRLDISRAGYHAVRHDLKMFPNTVNVAGPFYLAPAIAGGSGLYGYWAAVRDGLTISDPSTGMSIYLAPGIQRELRFRYYGTFYLSSVPYSAVADLAPASINTCQVGVIWASRYPVNNFNATVTMPNRDNLAPGSEVDVWNLNPTTKRFQIVSVGRVSADGASVEGPIVWASMFFAAPPAPLVMASADMNPTSRTPTLLADGNVSQAIGLPGVMSLGQDRSQALVYNSASADPRPVVSMDTTILGRTGVPATIEGVLEVGGVVVAGPFAIDTQSPSPMPEDLDATIRHAAQFDAGELVTGIHPYRFTATANYGCSTVSASVTGEMIVNNQSDSPFGAGWTLAGLERLHIEEDGDLLLTDGSGAAKAFDANPRPNFLPPVGIPADGAGAGALDDLNGDGNLDMAVPEMGNGDFAVLLGDGAGGFPVDIRTNAGTPPVPKSPLEPELYPDTTTIATGDFNSDGLRDLLVSTQMSGRVRLYIGNGDGSFQPPADFWRSRPQGLAVGDFDNDGNDDFVVGTLDGNTNLTNYRTYVYFGDGAGNFPADRIASFVVPWPGTPVVADFDNNGTPDIAVASAPVITAPSKIVVALSDGEGGFTASQTGTDPIRNTTGRFPLATADFNADGNMDLALTVAGKNWFTIYFGNGIGGFFQQMRVPTGIGEANSLTATDYDEDGDMDIIASGLDAAAIVLFESDGNGGLAVDETLPVGDIRLASVRAGDFNNDGAPDLQTGDPDNIYVLLADRRAERRFRSPGADFSQLDRTPDGGYVRRMTDGTVMEYNEDGLMTARIDANGNRTDYGYDSGGLLSSISDPADTNDPARATVFDYSGDGIEAITDLAGRTSFFKIDGEGNLISFADADSNVFRYAYDGDSRLSAFASARGFVTTVDYGFAGQYLGTNNPDGTSVTAEVTGSLGLVDPGLATGDWIAPEDRIAKMQDAKGNIYEFEVNEYGQPIRYTDPIGRTTTILRDANNLVIRTTAPTDNDPSGVLVTEMDYDESGNVTAKREAAGTALARETRFEYEPEFNRTIKVIDPAGGETVMTYDARGNPLTITDAGGGVQSFTYDLRGLRLTATDANGNETAFAYDFYGNMKSSTNGEGEVTKMVRDDAGAMTGVTEGFDTPAERTTAYLFDDLGRTVQITDPDGGVTETVYDADGNVIAEIDETGIAAETEYDEMGRTVAEIHPATGRLAKTWDENGNMASMIDPTGKVAHFEYDAVNRATRTEDPAGGIRAFAYDAQDKPIEVIDANGNATAFKYDALGREIERSNAPGDTWTFAYDSRDNMVLTTDAKGQRIEKTYDELNRMTRMIMFRADGSTEDDQTFAYDAMGQKTLAFDFDSSLAWAYDGANRVASAAVHGGVANAQPQTVLTHAYNAVGERTSLSDSEGGDTRFTHDADGNLTGVMTPAGDVIDLEYDPAGRLTRIANLTNAVETQVLYDALTGRPGRIDTTQGGAPLLPLTYGFDTDGKITSIADNGGVRNFTYDETLQVTGGGYASAPESYAYDPEGNRTSSHLSATYSHDTANRLREDEDACYEYDENGNLITKTARVGLAGCIGDETSYEWDVLNRLVRIDNPDGSYAAYRYDAQGRRIEKDVNGALTKYVYDGDAILLEYDGANSLQARYSHGEEIDQPLAMTRGADSYFYGVDHLGSVRLVTDAAGAVANRYDYDAFGNLEATSYETVTNPFGFTARERDAESGLMFYRARYYDPRIGRFISEDPIGFAGEDLNLYRYVFNGSVNMIDPTGTYIVSTILLGAKIGLRVGALYVALKIVIPRIIRAVFTGAMDRIKASIIKRAPQYNAGVGFGIGIIIKELTVCDAAGAAAGAATGTVLKAAVNPKYVGTSSALAGIGGTIVGLLTIAACKAGIAALVASLP